MVPYSYNDTTASKAVITGTDVIVRMFASVLLVIPLRKHLDSANLGHG